MARVVVLSVAVLFVGALGFMTVRVALTAGFTPVVAFSALLVVMVGFGVIGALTSSGDD